MATQFNTEINVLKNKKILQFPLGLGSFEKDRYGKDQQYIMLKINSDEKSSKLRDDKSLGQVMVTNSRTGTGIATDTANAKPESWKPKSTDPDLKLLFSDADVNKQIFHTQKGMQRLDRVVVLPMPDQHMVSTSVSYDTEYSPNLLTKAGDMLNQMGGGVAGDLAKLGKNAAISGLLSSVKSGAGSLANTLSAGVIPNTKGDIKLNDVLAEERAAINPKKEVLFKGFGYREFSFRYTFSPKSALETETLKEIIETLRYYSLPEISAGKLFYWFPAEFELTFMQGQKINPNIPRITTSVLRRVGVNYSPSGVWATLPDGHPVAIELSLEFLELELVDRSRVWNATSPITSGF